MVCEVNIEETCTFVILIHPTMVFITWFMICWIILALSPADGARIVACSADATPDCDCSSSFHLHQHITHDIQHVRKLVYAPFPRIFQQPCIV